MAVKLQEARLHEQEVIKCYHCGQSYLLETTEDGQTCPFCGWAWYMSKRGLDKLVRKCQRNNIG